MLQLWRKQGRKAGEFKYGQSRWDVEDSQQDQLAGLLRDLGYTVRERKDLLRRIGEVAE